MPQLSKWLNVAFTSGMALLFAHSALNPAQSGNWLMREGAALLALEFFSVLSTLAVARLVRGNVLEKAVEKQRDKAGLRNGQILLAGWLLAMTIVFLGVSLVFKDIALFAFFAISVTAKFASLYFEPELAGETYTAAMAQLSLIIVAVVAASVINTQTVPVAVTEELPTGQTYTAYKLLPSTGGFLALFGALYFIGATYITLKGTPSFLAQQPTDD